MKTAVSPVETSAPRDLLEVVGVPERDRIAMVQRDAIESDQERAHPGDWIVAKLLLAGIALIVAMNVYDFVRGLLGF